MCDYGPIASREAPYRSVTGTPSAPSSSSLRRLRNILLFPRAVRAVRFQFVPLGSFSRLKSFSFFHSLFKQRDKSDYGKRVIRSGFVVGELS